MARLDGQDGASDGEVLFCDYLGGGTEVGADADTFEDTGECDERFGVCRGELIHGFFDGGGSCCDEGA